MSNNRQFKNLPHFELKAAREGRVRKGIAAVFGNVDSWGDRIIYGAFAKTIAEGRDRVKHLWNHSFSEVPIAKIVELKEIGRDELPPEVLEYAPEATGGLMVAREYLNSEKANAVLEALDAGAITEMSFAYDVMQSSETEDSTHGKIRELKELKLMDTSDVIWGMNPATVALGAKADMPLGLVVQNLMGYVDEMKAGRRNAGTDESLINAIHRASIDLGCTECAGYKEEEKSVESQPAAAVLNVDTALLANRLNLAKTRSQLLTR